MPMYDYECTVCGRKREVLLKVQDLNSPVYCQRDGFAMRRLISAPYVQGDIPPYECPVTGRMIEGRRAHMENLAKTGCRILEPGETAQTARARQQVDEQLEKKLEETAESFIANLPTEKRDKLAAEMEGGITANVERLAPKL